MTHPHWGDVPTWCASVGTLVAVGVSVCTALRAEAATRAARSEASRLHAKETERALVDRLWAEADFADHLRWNHCPSVKAYNEGNSRLYILNGEPFSIKIMWAELTPDLTLTGNVEPEKGYVFHVDTNGGRVYPIGPRQWKRFDLPANLNRDLIRLPAICFRVDREGTTPQEWVQQIDGRMLRTDNVGS